MTRKTEIGRMNKGETIGEIEVKPLHGAVDDGKEALNKIRVRVSKVVVKRWRTRIKTRLEPAASKKERLLCYGRTSLRDDYQLDGSGAGRRQFSPPVWIEIVRWRKDRVGKVTGI